MSQEFALKITLAIDTAVLTEKLTTLTLEDIPLPITYNDLVGRVKAEGTRIMVPQCGV